MCIPNQSGARLYIFLDSACKCSAAALYSFRILLVVGSLWNCRIFYQAKTHGTPCRHVTYPFLLGGRQTSFSITFHSQRQKWGSDLDALFLALCKIFCKNMSRPSRCSCHLMVETPSSLRATSQSSLLALAAHDGPVHHKLSFTAHRALKCLWHDRFRFQANGGKMN